MQSAKRRKIVETVSSTKQNQQKSIQTIEQEKPAYDFLDLNDHCILEIFARLDLESLCSTAHTCQHLYRLAKYHFGLQYPYQAKNMKRFEKIERNLLTRSSFTPYIHCFGDLKTITFNKDSMCPTLAKNFVDTQMNKPPENRIKCISFECFKNNKYLEMCKKFHEIFFDVQVVRFVNMKANSLYKSILQYCPSMKELIIDGEFCVKCNKWMFRKFPKLEHLSLYTNNDIEWAYVQPLFQQNVNIKVSLLSQNTENITRFIDNGVNINELHIRVKYNFDYYIDYLKVICSKSISIRLHLSFVKNVRRNLSRNIKHLVDLKNNIDGLYFEFGDLDQEIVNEIMKIERLIVLQIPIEGCTQALAHLPNLKEVYIFSCMTCNPASPIQCLELLQELAGHGKNLQKLVYRYQTEIRQTKRILSIVESINILRKTLDDAERLKFCFNTKSLPKMPLDAIDVLDICCVNKQPLVKFEKLH